MYQPRFLFVLISPIPTLFKCLRFFVFPFLLPRLANRQSGTKRFDHTVLPLHSSTTIRAPTRGSRLSAKGNKYPSCRDWRSSPQCTESGRRQKRTKDKGRKRAEDRIRIKRNYKPHGCAVPLSFAFPEILL